MISTVVTIVASFTAVDGLSRASELGEDEARHVDHRINAKSPDYCRGSGFIGGLLLLRHAGVGCRVPHAASLIAVGLCLGRGYVLSKS